METPSGPGHYVPILKGRLGELTALGNLSPGATPRLTPLIELVPAGVELDESGDGATPESLRESLEAFAKRLRPRQPPVERLILDAGLLPASTDPRDPPPIVLAIEALANDPIVAVPAIRPSDGNAIAEVARHGYPGACIRLAGEDLDDNDRPIADAVQDTVDTLGIAPGAIDLVLDIGPVEDSRVVSFASKILRLVLAELPDLESWRTVTIAGGAFPTGLDKVQAGVLSELPRFDVDLWLAVRDRARGRVPSFGDYGIAHPTYVTGQAFAPAPQLRYTAENRWLVMKGRRGVRRGSKQFLDICERIAQQPDFTAGLSWGDQRIADAANEAWRDDDDPQVSTGNAATWRAIGTSHHIAHVLSRLANGGAP